jgi:hypothetical protein
MAIIINEAYDVNVASPIDKRLIVDRVDGTESLVSLIPQYNYPNMYVWVKEEKAFYYLKDIVDDINNPGATVSDWEQASGGGSGCAKSGYVSGASFTGNPATASVVFSAPYSSASYSVVVTSHAFNDDDYIYSITNKTENGFTIRVDFDTTPPLGGPIGATAMWITNCWDGSGLFNGVGGGPGGGSVIDVEEIAFGTGTGITSSNLFTFNNTNTSLILGFDNTITNSRGSAIIGGTANTINNSTASSILSTINVTIHGSFYSTSISNYGSTICGSRCSNIISSFYGFMTQSDNSSIISTYNSQIWESKHSVILGGGAGNCICSPNLGGSHYGGIVFGGGNLICDSSESSIFNSGGSCIMGSILNGQNNILGGRCNKIYCSRSSGIIGGFCSSLTSSTTTTCFNSIFYSSHSQIVGNTFSRFNIIMGSTGSSIKYLGTGPVGKGNTIRNPNNSFIIGGNCNTILGACNSVILGGCGITIIGVTTSVYSSAQNCRFNNVVAVPSLIGFGSLSLSVKTASTTDYPGGLDLDNNYFTLIAYPDDPGSLDVCLPQADALGRIYVIKKAGTSTYSTVKIYPRGSECIDGYAGYIELINPWDYNMLQADGVDNWIKLGGAVGINL